MGLLIQNGTLVDPRGRCRGDVLVEDGAIAAVGQRLPAAGAEVYEAVGIPVVGMGGVSTAEDVIEMMLAGASAVEVGAANLRDPLACKTIIEALPGVCQRLGVTQISNLTGGAHS